MADRWSLISLKFPKGDGWTEPKVKTWLKQHPDVGKSFRWVKMFLDETIVTKRLDLSGNMSIYEICDIVQSSLRKLYYEEDLFPDMEESPGSQMTAETAPTESKHFDDEEHGWVSLRDLYPTSYPNGNVVFAICECGDEDLYQAEYSVDTDTKEATFSNISEVSEGYVEKSLDWLFTEGVEDFSVGIEELEEKLSEAEVREKTLHDELVLKVKENSELIVTKEGRFLSKKNRSLVQSALNALKDLLDSTASDEEDTSMDGDKSVKDVEKKEVKTEEPAELDISIEDIKNAVKESFKIDVEEIVKNSIARVTGNVNQ